ncbi:MAG: DNA mismatch repair protein MutS [Desulfobulbaceae bacterium S3730MH12]|nr:MAG: DNA mismatch repair protein MutS [Desulfobulbaceae bacterium S5133MH15]OEU58578.1 MAG: DNA mismatch repair protein MutS [Desulfobulbaceae bacterium S3730MH12]OEU78495.1 MAG: DNA mismatch repair protein MutS [Desulfobulbaceae bacterium C00003063]
MEDEHFPTEPIEIEIDGTLDLHTFSPKDLKYLIPDYLDECYKREIFQVKIIHGKGTGNLRRSVHALLDRNPLVAGYRLADLFNGSWGATVVELKTTEVPGK